MSGIAAGLGGGVDHFAALRREWLSNGTLPLHTDASGTTAAAAATPQGRQLPSYGYHHRDPSPARLARHPAQGGVQEGMEGGRATVRDACPTMHARCPSPPTNPPRRVPALGKSWQRLAVSQERA